MLKTKVLRIGRANWACQLFGTCAARANKTEGISSRTSNRGTPPFTSRVAGGVGAACFDRVNLPWCSSSREKVSGYWTLSSNTVPCDVRLRLNHSHVRGGGIDDGAMTSQRTNVTRADAAWARRSMHIPECTAAKQFLSFSTFSLGSV